VSADTWHRVTLTTYALSLSFFEAIVLDRLIRGGGRQAMILADVEGVRASLSEPEARPVGTGLFADTPRLSCPIRGTSPQENNVLLSSSDGGTPKKH